MNSVAIIGGTSAGYVPAIYKITLPNGEAEESLWRLPVLRYSRYACGKPAHTLMEANTLLVKAAMELRIPLGSVCSHSITCWDGIPEELCLPNWLENGDIGGLLPALQSAGFELVDASGNNL